MAKNTSNNGQKPQSSTAEESDLKRNYKRIRELQERAAKLEDPAIKRFLERRITKIQATLDKTTEDIDGLEAIVNSISPLHEADAAPEPSAEKVEAPKFIRKTQDETEEKGKPQTADYMEYVATYFVQNPGKDRLYVADLIRATGGVKSTVRDYLNAGRLPLQVKKEPKVVKTNGKAATVSLYIDNETVDLQGIVIPKAVLASWKAFGTLEESELYLYTTHDKVEQLKDAVDKYDGELKVKIHELDPYFAFKYPYFRQLAKNKCLIDIFNKLLDKDGLSQKEYDKIKEFKGDQVLLYQWENAVTNLAAPVVYFLTGYSDVKDDKRHLANPIVKLLKERGLFLAEIIQVLDKPVSRVLHAVEILSGTDRTGCIYKLLNKPIECLQMPKLISSYSLQDGRVDFRFMPAEARDAYVECLRYGIKPEPTDKDGHAKNFKASVDGRGFQLNKNGIYEGSRQVSPAEFSELLKTAYQKRIGA